MIERNRKPAPRHAPTGKVSANDGARVAGPRPPDRNSDGTFAPGNPGGPGRRKGTPNKVNAVLRDDIVRAYEKRGGVDFLNRLPAPLFVRLLERILPRQVAADVNVGAGDLFRVDFAAMSHEELERLAHAVDADLDFGEGGATGAKAG